MAKWVDEITLVKETEPADSSRVDEDGFPRIKEEVKRVIFCNEKSVGYSEYFKSEQTGKAVIKKYEVHKADYEGEDTVEDMAGKRYFVLKTYDMGDDIVELTLTDLRHKENNI